MLLSKRLTALAGMVRPGSRLADVGTDHGYVPISLIEQKKIPSAIAMDINKGPLLRAKEHIQLYGYENYIETRLSDGLHALKAGEADTVLIAGMGGDLVRRILEEGREVLESVQELILQPQSEIYKVRMWLEEHGWHIDWEDIVYEDQKYYPMMRAVPGVENEPYTPAEYRFGKGKVQRSAEILREFIGKQKLLQQQILSSLPDSQEPRIRMRREAVLQELELLETVQLPTNRSFLE